MENIAEGTCSEPGNSIKFNMSDYVPVAEHKLLKMKYEFIESDNEKLIFILERLKDLYGCDIDDIVKIKEELLMVKTLQMVDESGINSGGSKLNVKKAKKSVPNDDVIVISDDDDEGNQRKSSRRRLW